MIWFCGDPLTDVAREELTWERSVKWDFDGPPYWIRIGPISWEGSY